MTTKETSISVDKLYREKIRRLDTIEHERNEFEKQVESLKSRSERLGKDVDRLQGERDGFQKQAASLKSRNQDLMKKVEELAKKIAAGPEPEDPGVAAAVKRAEKAESDLAEMTAKYGPLVEQNETLQSENKTLKDEIEKHKIRIKELLSSGSSKPSAIILFIAVFLVFLPLSRPLQSLYGMLEVSNYSWFVECLNLFIALQLGLIMIWIYSRVRKARV